MGPFWSLFGPFFVYFGSRILYFGPGIVLSLMESFIRNDRAIFVSFLVPFLDPESYISRIFFRHFDDMFRYFGDIFRYFDDIFSLFRQYFSLFRRYVSLFRRYFTLFTLWRPELHSKKCSHNGSCNKWVCFPA